MSIKSLFVIVPVRWDRKCLIRNCQSEHDYGQETYEYVGEDPINIEPAKLLALYFAKKDSPLKCYISENGYFVEKPRHALENSSVDAPSQKSTKTKCLTTGNRSLVFEIMVQIDDAVKTEMDEAESKEEYYLEYSLSKCRILYLVKAYFDITADPILFKAPLALKNSYKGLYVSSFHNASVPTASGNQSFHEIPAIKGLVAICKAYRNKVLEDRLFSWPDPYEDSFRNLWTSIAQPSVDASTTCENILAEFQECYSHVLKEMRDLGRKPSDFEVMLEVAREQTTEFLLQKIALTKKESSQKKLPKAKTELIPSGVVLNKTKENTSSLLSEAPPETPDQFLHKLLF